MITFLKICFKLKAVWALRKLNKNHRRRVKWLQNMVILLLYKPAIRALFGINDSYKK